MSLAWQRWPAWAARDLARHPAEAALLAGGFASFVFVSAAVLLLNQGMAETARRVIQHGPSLVVRRVGPTGWQTIPEAAGLAAARSVVGVIRVQPRVWGVVRGPRGPVNVIGYSERDAPPGGDSGALVPLPGQALVGPGFSPIRGGDSLILHGVELRELTVVDVLDQDVSIVAHDVVLLHPDDARAVLGIGAEMCSDLAVDVFRPEEQDAILPDLAAAFPWPVRITTQSENIGQYVGGISRRGGLVLLLLVPSLLWLSLLLLLSSRWRMGRQRDVGLLKALGWTAQDILSLQLWRAVLVALPPLSLGFVLAYGFVHSSANTWIAVLLLGWTRAPPVLTLSPAGTWLVLLEVVGWVLAPWLASAAWGAFRGASSDPMDLLAEES